MAENTIPEIIPQNYKIKSWEGSHKPTGMGNMSLCAKSGKFILALDIGYSSVKGYTANNSFIFPFFARKLNISSIGELIGSADKKEVIYRDDVTGEFWRVGESAQLAVSQDDTSVNVSRDERNRYKTREFLVCARVGIAQAFMTMKDFNGHDPMEYINDFILQTGLPTKYVETDTKKITSALAGRHQFSVMMAGSSMWKFDFELPAENIFVASQPNGTIANFIFGSTRNTDIAKNISKENVLICDFGYGTLDTVEIMGRAVRSKNTYTNLGMYAVLTRLAKKVTAAIGVDANPVTIQKWLASGIVTAIDDSGDIPKQINVDIKPFLEEASNEVCNEAIKTIAEVENPGNYKYIIITGGTGSAWFQKIASAFDGSGIKIIPASSADDETNNTFANVRGYYLLRLLKENSNAAKA